MIFNALGVRRASGTVAATGASDGTAATVSPAAEGWLVLVAAGSEVAGSGVPAAGVAGSGVPAAEVAGSDVVGSEVAGAGVAAAELACVELVAVSDWPVAVSVCPADLESATGAMPGVAVVASVVDSAAAVSVMDVFVDSSAAR